MAKIEINICNFWLRMIMICGFSMSYRWHLLFRSRIFSKVTIYFMTCYPTYTYTQFTHTHKHPCTYTQIHTLVLIYVHKYIVRQTLSLFWLWPKFWDWTCCSNRSLYSSYFAKWIKDELRGIPYFGRFLLKMNVSWQEYL